MANILVVDDEMGIRELLSEILNDEGHSVITAENAQQARDARISNTLDLVLLDIWMPDTDGVTLLKEWQCDGLLSMPVIMMSGHGTIDIAVEATRIGAMSFLEKPIALKKFLKAVEQGLVRSTELRQIRKYAPVVNLENARLQELAALNVYPENVAESNQINRKSESDQFNISFELPLREARDVFERIYFEHHLARERGSMTRVAEKSGLERTHLYRKLKQLGVESGKQFKKNA